MLSFLLSNLRDPAFSSSMWDGPGCLHSGGSAGPGVPRKKEGCPLNGHSRFGELGYRSWEERDCHEAILGCEELSTGG